MGGVNNSILPAHCKECKYRGRTGGTYTCDYIIFEEHSRGCKVEECDKWKDGTPKDRITFWMNKDAKAHAIKTMTLETDPRTAEYMPLYEKGMSDKEIAEALNIQQKNVWNWRDRYGLMSSADRATMKLRERMKELYDQGLNDIEISKIVGKTATTVGIWRRSNDLPSNSNRGYRHEEI